MIVSKIPYSRLDPGNELARAYAVEPDRVLGLFSHDYRDPRALEPLLAARPRPALAERLVEYNRAVGGSAENAARIDDAFCVISGQQVGLLFGPAYTTYKLFTVINAARLLEVELGVPVVPVFWVESEDHDWAEANRFFFKDKRYRIEVDIPHGTPVSQVEVDAAHFVGALKMELDAEAEAWGLVEPEGNVARWHVRNLARLVEGRGVVFVEPQLLREPMRPTAERIAGDPAAIDASLERETGFEPALGAPGGNYFFAAGEGGRRRVERGAPLPERWSTDVVSRVLIQNAAFRVLMAVCGPSEIRYWSQLKAAHEAFGIEMPAVLPRDAATLVEQGTARDAAKLGIDLETFVRGEAAPPEAGVEDPVAKQLRKLAGEAGSLREAVEEGALDLPPNADRPFRRTVARLREDLDKLAGRIDDARAEAQGAGRRRFERVLRELRPRGGLQERTHSLFPYLVRHGPGLAGRLLETFDPFEIGHYLVQL